MPSGPTELHAKWKSDYNAIAYLIEAGYKPTKDWFWICPEGKTPEESTETEREAICYLCWEWDFGGYDAFR